MQLTNYHTHTNFCDGVEIPIHYVHEALRKKIKVLGFSAHAPLPFACSWTLPKEKHNQYIQTIHQLKKQYEGEIEILCGLEIDYIPELWQNIYSTCNPLLLDFFIGSIHFIDSFEDGTRWTIDGSNSEFYRGWSEIFGKDSHAVIRKYFAYTREMLAMMKPPIIGHLDKIKMQYNEHCFIPDTDALYQKEALETLESIKASGCVVEINTRGMYRRNEPDLYPGFWLLQKMAAMNIPVTINSDAHRPQEIVSFFDIAQSQLHQAGYKETVYFSNGEWKNAKLA